MSKTKEQEALQDIADIMKACKQLGNERNVHIILADIVEILKKNGYLDINF